jgi:hypothetical protein
VHGVDHGQGEAGVQGVHYAGERHD